MCVPGRCPRTRRPQEAQEAGTRNKKQEVKGEAKCMVSLSSKSVLSEYLTSENVQHSSRKLRVRGVQIRCLLGNVLNRGEMKCD